jgi:hypothetical protein
MIFIMSKEIEEEYQERRLGVRISLLTIDCKRGGPHLILQPSLSSYLPLNSHMTPILDLNLVCSTIFTQ